MVPGFNPDPSVVRVGEDYYLATSTFEYLPGVPIYHSRDLTEWELIGHVVTRPGQLQVDGVPTGGGAWAPTIRHHDGRFYLVITDAMGRGTMIFTADDPAGPWDDGLVVTGVDGIDPDIAWDDDGTCFMTYSGLVLSGTSATHHGIQQVRLDLATGTALEEPRSMWSGTGLMFPESPHLYRIGDWWYLMIAEGGTERGHAISIARAATPDGPFEGCRVNPILSARSTARPVQNTGHGDLVELVDGTWACILLGMRTRGMTRSFSSLGRETFVTTVDWIDGWPEMAPVELTPGLAAPSFRDDFDADDFDGEWMGVRRFPASFAKVADGALVLVGEGQTMNDREPTFLGRRQRRLDARIRAHVTAATGIGGLALRFDEYSHIELEVQPDAVVARLTLPMVVQERSVPRPAGPLVLSMVMADPAGGMEAGMTSDIIQLGLEQADGSVNLVGSFDGRYLSAEVTCSFTGRVAGVYCTSGELVVDRYEEIER